MQLELVGDLLAHLDAAHAVALRVERRRIDADADLARDHGEDAARDPALRRHPDLVGPLAGVVVHAAGIHHREHVAHVVGMIELHTGQRVDAVIGERCRHDGEVAAGDGDGALAEIEVERLDRVATDHAGVEHHIGDGAVAMAGCQFRAEHRVVDIELPRGEVRKQVDHGRGAFFRGFARHHRRDRDGAGIDHGVEGPVRDLVEHDGVERLACRLDADTVEHVGAAELLQREAMHEWLRDRLNGEGVAGVTGGVDPAVDGRQRNAKGAGIGLAELGDVVGDPAAALLRDAGMQLGEKLFDRGEENSSAAFRRARVAS